MKLSRFAVYAALTFVVPTSAQADVWTFETPSENIQCSVGQEPDFSEIQCTIIERQGDLAASRPSSCRADWGHTFFMRDTGAAEILCVETDNNKDAFDRAEYGVTGEFGGFTCHSSQQGFECTNRDGNGFFLSRASQSIIENSAQDQAYSRAVPPSGELTTQMVQTALSTLGFDVGDIDGVMGPATRSAIEAWQRSNNWPVNGVLSLDQSVLLTVQFREAYALVDDTEARWSAALENQSNEAGQVTDLTSQVESHASQDTERQTSEASIVAYQPLLNDPLVDYQVESCDGTRGFSILTYGTSNDVIRLSDVCLLESEGVVISGETLSGLELTQQSRNGRVFEDLSSGNDEYSRNRISFFPDENAPGCIAENLESFEYVIPNQGSLNNFSETGFAMARGYTLPAIHLLPRGLGQSVEVLISIRSLSQGELTSRSSGGFPHQTAVGDLYGEAVFSPDGGQLNIHNGGGYSYGDADGGLEFSFAGDGGFLATGSFFARSLRIAGHAADEMLEITGEIPYLRGHILGSNGAQMLGFGLVVGSYKDVSGQEHPFRGSASLIVCMG